MMWDYYRLYIVVAAILLVLQTTLIAILLVQRMRRPRVEQALRSNELALRRSSARNQRLLGRLITIQEAERSRIARDLHDDVSQQLAALGMTLSALKQRLIKTTPDREIEETLTLIQRSTAALAEEIRTLSHELHPGLLQHVGLVAALRGHCVEFERHHKIDVTLSTDDNLGVIDPDVSLCLFRVAQEALANIARHARATTTRILLKRTPDEIELNIIDDGVGFDSNHRNRAGLGLQSIDERVSYKKGTVTVRSQPGHGTRLLVRIPAAAAT